MRTSIVNGIVLDTESMRMLGERTVVCENDLIVDVAEPATSDTAGADLVIDARGRFVLPGFIDGHVHHVITTMDFPQLMRLTDVERSLGMAGLAAGMVHRGFTTVRDTGGDITGLIRAIEQGMCDGPRIIRSGRVISQTGGHGDFAPVDGPLCACQIHSNHMGHVADGADAVRKAVRTELRAGSDFIKIMSSGGVTSLTDPFDAIQYTAEEVLAATVETDHRHTYTTSHAYQPDAISLAIENGVRCIEHGNFLDAPTARRMAELGVTMVPTLVSHVAIFEIGSKSGLPQRNLDKNAGAYEFGRSSIAIAKKAGVELGFGTDLLGEAQPWQNREFAIRAELEPAVDVLRSMYQVNARLCRLEGEIGVVSPGASADLVITPVDPFTQLPLLADPEESLSAVIARGRLVVDRLED